MQIKCDQFSTDLEASITKDVKQVVGTDSSTIDADVQLLFAEIKDFLDKDLSESNEKHKAKAMSHIEKIIHCVITKILGPVDLKDENALNSALKEIKDQADLILGKLKELAGAQNDVQAFVRVLFSIPKFFRTMVCCSFSFVRFCALFCCLLLFLQAQATSLDTDQRSKYEICLASSMPPRG